MKVIFVKQTKSRSLRIPRQKLTLVCQLTQQFVKKYKLWGPDVDTEARSATEITLVFVDSKESQQLNSKYRGKNKPTDVLSFAASDLSSMGDLVFCAAVIEKQAPRFNNQFQQELFYMVIHGMLHLYGWDHEKSIAEEKKMFSIQDEIYQKIAKKVGYKVSASVRK